MNKRLISVMIWNPYTNVKVAFPQYMAVNPVLLRHRTGIGQFNQPLLYNYGYDQLNWIISMDAFSGLDEVNNNWTALSKMSGYQERK